MRTEHPRQRVFVSALLLLLGAGWAANHFSSLLGPLRQWEDLSGITVNAAFGIYALGLLPSLLGGGVLVDRIGARGVVLTGATLAAAGNTSLLFWHDEVGVLVGRFIVGLGVGLTTSAGTVWAGQLRPHGGAVLAGIFLTSGFAVGPVFSGAILHLAPESYGLVAALALTVTFSLATVALALIIGNAAPPSPTSPAQKASQPLADAPYRTLGRALAAALPMAIWVFSTVTITIVILADRARAEVIPFVLVPGLAALLSFVPGLLIQVISRRRGWGPAAGVAGALLSAIGMGLAAIGGSSLSLSLFVPACMILGCAYGLSLQQGLLDVSYLAPANAHGLAVGIFYVAAYLGFSLPVLMEVALPVAGARVPFLLLAILALVSATIRMVQLKRTDLLVRADARRP